MWKLWNAIHAQLNKLAHFFWTRDPIAQMQLEYDRSVEQLKEGRRGLEEYRGLVERVSRQVAHLQKKEQMLTSRIKAYLKTEDRQTAGQLAIQLQETRLELNESQEQLKMHETAYGNNVEKIKHSSKSLAKVQEKIKKYQAELKMSKAEAEMARLSQAFDFDLTTDFGQIEQIIHDKIDLNRGKVRVAADLSERGLEEIRAEKVMEESLAEDLLTQFEVDMGLKTPETAEIKTEKAKLGPEESSEHQISQESVKQNRK
jgi:phage shock protein A